MNLTHTTPKNYKFNEHIEKLSMNKPEYNETDYFKGTDFRGLILADN
jgi:hypothetical protein